MAYEYFLPGYVHVPPMQWQSYCLFTAPLLHLRRYIDFAQQEPYLDQRTQVLQLGGGECENYAGRDTGSVDYRESADTYEKCFRSCFMKEDSQGGGIHVMKTPSLSSHAMIFKKNAHTSEHKCRCEKHGPAPRPVRAAYRMPT